MKQGTVSWFYGCHSVMHSLLVLKSWRILYGSWPRPWQIVCIFLHDIGHIGLNYLDSMDEKCQHWQLGAWIARALFGTKGFAFLAGHCSHSRHPLSELYKADKYSWYIAPTWWLWLNNISEPKLTINCSGNMDAIRKFRAMVKESIESGEYTSTHDMYLKRVAGDQT
jgi:hypothetical protein